MSPKRNAEPSIEERALKILRDADFFGKLRSIISRCGLVGETRNALALYIVAISSLLVRPLSAILKGLSSSGKNILARKVLRLLPDTAVREITSSSKTAWNYSGDDFKNSVVYVQERNDGSGNVHPVRLLISEGKLIRTVTVRKNGQNTTQTFVANGPIAAITTTTKDRLEIDDETRSISLWLDESDEQTVRIMEGDVSAQPELPQVSEEEVKTWHKVYDLIYAFPYPDRASRIVQETTKQGVCQRHQGAAIFPRISVGGSNNRPHPFVRTTPGSVRNEREHQCDVCRLRDSHLHFQRRIWRKPQPRRVSRNL